MEISGEFSFNTSQKKVWAVLRDPKALSLIVPMSMNMKQIDETQYTGDLFFKVGNIAGKFRGTIELLNVQEPDSYEIEVKGSSPVGHVHIQGRMHLEEQDEQTTMFYSGNVAFGGRIATVGSRVLEFAVTGIMEKSFKSLNLYLSRKH